MKARSSSSVDNRGMMIKLFICIAAAGATLYAYIMEQNELTQLRLAIPAVEKELRHINDENTRLRYEIDQFESPVHLIELSRKPEFGHLKYPYVNNIIVIDENSELVEKSQES